MTEACSDPEDRGVDQEKNQNPKLSRGEQVPGEVCRDILRKAADRTAPNLWRPNYQNGTPCRVLESTYVCHSISIRISSRPRLRDMPSCVPFRCSTTPAELRSHKSLAPDVTKPGPPLLCVYSPLKAEMLCKL